MTRAEFYSNLMNYQKVQNDPDAETIKHYGIIGQKWGQRRWQNADGTFNTEGKIRYFGSQKAQAEKMQNEKVGSTWDNNAKSRYDNYKWEYERALKKGNTNDAEWYKKKLDQEAEKYGFEKIGGKNGKVGGWYMDSVTYNTPSSATEHAIAQQRVSARLQNETMNTYSNSDKGKLSRIMERDYFSRLDRMQSALSKGKTEKYDKLLNKFKPEDRELVDDYVKKLNKHTKENEDAYMYDFNNDREKFYADSGRNSDGTAKDQKIGGFGNIKNKAEADRAIELLENEYDKACSDIIHHMDEYDKYSSRAQAIMKQIEELDERFGSQPGGKKLNEKETINDTIKGIFSKKNKAEDTIKKLEEEGQEDIAKEYKKHAKELDQYKKIGSQPGMNEEERKATKRACANCWKVAMRNKWPLFFLFGVLGGGVIGAIASNSKINKMIDQLGLDRQDKDKFTADDWDKITEAIKDSRRKKPKNAE